MNRETATGHVISPEAKQIIDDFWPSRPKDYHSLPLYREMQAELIQLHYPKMSREDKERAVKTYERLMKNANEPLI